MKKYNQPIELIVKRQPSTMKAKSAPIDISKTLKNSGIEVEIISDNQPTLSKKKSSKVPIIESDNIVLKTKAKDTEVNPWDMAHISFDSLGKEGGYIEPNFLHEFIVDKKIDVSAAKISAKTFGGSGKTADDFDPDWQPHSNTIWHLGDNFSQLKTARESVAAIDYNIRIGHLDTGYSKTHSAIPDSIKQNPLQRNFVIGENPNDAHDPFDKGFLKMPGHGSGTLGVLAGAKIDIATADGRFQDFLGAAYFAEVICCRISETVILLKTNVFADALNYLTQLSLTGTQVHVVSMSMGGAPSKVWANAVNAAYEAGITLVTAAGNNFAGLPTQHVIYPARFGRVIAACGVTNEYKPYLTKKLDEMQGCCGPKKHMSKALASFTPNIPFINTETDTIRFSGGGTSAVTPQIAAAAAIYYRKYHEELDKLEPWKRVEAIRNALYKSAIKKVNDPKYDSDFAQYFGNGIIQVNDALNIPVATNLAKTEEDKVPWFPILNTIFKAKPNPQQSIRLDMFNTELSQLVFSHPELNELIDSDTRDYEKIGQKKWKEFRDAVMNHPSTSVTLRKYLKETSKLK